MAEGHLALWTYEVVKNVGLARGCRAERWELGSLWYPGVPIPALDGQTLGLFFTLEKRKK